MKLLGTLVFLFCLMPVNIVFGNQAKILVLLPFASKSHKNVFTPLVEALAARGHDITVISPYKATKTIANLKEFAIDENKKSLEETHKQMFQTLIGSGLGANLGGFIDMTKNGCINFLNAPITKQMIEKGKTFDLVIAHAFMNDCAVVVAALVGKNVIYLSPASMPTQDIRTAPAPASFVPMLMMELTSKMNFFQRVQNTIGTAAATFGLRYFLDSTLQAALSEHLPDAPTLDDARKLISLVLFNADPVLSPPLPGITNAIPVGAMHCVDAKPLPKDFEDYIQTSGEHGFIYFSLGSNAPSKYLPVATREAFVSVFARLKQKVIWKYEDDLPNKPDNVMITKWAPQQDILGHPKIRLFITHGGMLSLQETLYHGVPVVGIALFADQPSNVLRVQELKIGEKVNFRDVSEKTIYEAVTKVLNDQSYAENMKKYSAILRDQPQTPLDRAVFWTEYALRHNGAHHLRSVGQDLSFVEHYLLDVAAVLLLGFLVAAFVVCKVVKISLRFMKKKSSGATKKKTH